MPTATATTVDVAASIVVARNVLKICFACYAQSRGVLPADSFDHVRMFGHKDPLPTFNQTSTASRRLTEWLEKGVYHALSKRYLRQAALIILSPTDATILESLCFDLSFDGRGAVRFNPGGPLTREAVAEGAVTIIGAVQRHAASLPALAFPNCRMTLQVTYQDNCPVDYQPPCFSAAHPDFVAKLAGLIADRVPRQGAFSTGHLRLESSVARPGSMYDHDEAPPPDAATTTSATAAADSEQVADRRAAASPQKKVARTERRPVAPSDDDVDEQNESPANGHACPPPDAVATSAGAAPPFNVQCALVALWALSQPPATRIKPKCVGACPLLPATADTGRLAMMRSEGAHV